MSWNEGYITDIGYSHAYVPLTNPFRAALPLLKAGLAAPEIRTACELGFGQGVSIAVHAATQPEVEWWGTDFMPGHVAFARQMVEAAGAPCRIYDQSFAEFCARPDLPQFDAVVLHGVWTWVSPENRAVIVDFLHRKLRVGGVVYLGYNVLPGWSQNAPLRQLLALHAKTLGGGSAARIDGSLAFIERLLQADPAFLQSAPGAAAYFQALRGKARSYVAHEFLNEHWSALAFSQSAALLDQAKLSFGASAHYPDHLRKLPPAQQQLLDGIEDVALRESTRDVLTNESFRRDYWIKGPTSLLPRQRQAALRQQRFVLIDPAKAGAGAVAKALGDRAARTIEEIEAATGLATDAVVEAVMAAVAAGAVCQARIPTEAAVRGAAGINRLFIERAEAGDLLQVMASPVTGTAVFVQRSHQLLLAARLRGHIEVGAMAREAWDVLFSQGKGMIKDGRVLKTAEENIAEFERIAAPFVETELPVLQTLGIA